MQTTPIAERTQSPRRTTSRPRALGALGLGLGLLSLASALALQTDKAPPKVDIAKPLQGPVEVRVVWVDDKPNVEVAVEAKGEQKDVFLALDLWDPQNLLAWRTTLKVPAAGPGSWKGRFPLQNVKEPKKQHHLVVSLLEESLAIDYAEDIFFSGDRAALVQSYGIRSLGAYPSRKVFFTLSLNGFKGREMKDAPVALAVRDADDNLVFNRQGAIKPSPEPQRPVFDVTPDVSATVGPYKLEVGIESESNNLFFNASLPFAQPNALVPMSSLEHGDPVMWFAATGGTPESYRSVELHAPGQEAMYYSPHLWDLFPRDNPRLTYDRGEKHSGRQSLRVDYLPAGECNIWGLQTLPGKPLYLSFWVKGNESQDQLLVYFEDNINFGLQAWHRQANFSSAVVGTLNFSGWKRFRVPALGYGQQVSGLKGSTPKVDAPIRIMAFQIKPAPLAKGAVPTERRTIWIDDLAAETQVSATNFLSMEVQVSDPVGRLTADGKLAVSVGSGFGTELKRGKVALLARDVAGKAVWTKSLDLVVPPEAYATIEVPLNGLAAEKPTGPVDVEVTFQDPSRPGARISRSVVFKVAAQAGIVHDFEEPVTFNGYQPGKVGKSRAKVVPGGANGSGHSLLLPVMPKENDNSVLFHPALPGIVDGIEMMVHGGAKPVTLQVWFVDSGFTGIWLRNFNVFWADPITVDWEGWRKVVIPAPPVPAQYGDKRRYFFKQPWYPLNLALNATVDGMEPREVPVEIRIDDVRVVTHLPEAEQTRAEILYPDENRIHPPGSPLHLALTNFAAQAKPMTLSYKLTSYQGHVARSGKLAVSVAAGERQRVTLLDQLAPGIYDLEVQGIGPNPLVGCIQVLDSARYFGTDQEELLTNAHLLRRLLNLTTERIYLDWDNTEPVPHLYHSHWFEMELKKRREISQLPKELQPLAAKQASTAQAMQKLDNEARSARAQAAASEQGEKPVADNLAARIKAYDAIKPEVEAAMKALEPLVKAADEAAAKLKDAMTKDADAKKKLQADEAALKKAQQELATTDKMFQEADKAAKTAEGQVKPAQDAAAAAAKDVTNAEAELKKAEDGKDAKLIEDAKKKLEAARKQAETAKTKAETVKKEAETKRADADKLKAKAEALKKDVDKLSADVTADKKDAEKAKQALDAATKADTEAKQAKTKGEQQLQAVKQKLQNAENAVKNEKNTLEQRMKATADAVQKLADVEKNLEAAQVEAAAAQKEYETARAKYDFTMLPVVGFCADWAGPESADSLQRGTFMRWIPNMMQVPRHSIDWSLFVREVQREYKGRFAHWVFWENPDLEDSPQGLPPKKYAELLGIFSRWVKLYNAQAHVVLGGLNFSKSLSYLRRIPDVYQLPFDEIHVQMNLGELSPEHADVEGYLDDMNALLRLPEKKRPLRITELDWGIGPFLSPMRQAAYHARATLILDSRGVSDHQFTLINTGYDFDGYGVFYRVAYGNPLELQSHKAIHVPKPSFFALVETRRFLQEWKYVTNVQPTDRSLADNRAFIYRNAGGDLTVALWRAVEGDRSYRFPDAWKGAQARDIFGFPMTLDKGLPCTPLPTLVKLPAGYALEQLVQDLRMLRTTDDSYPVVLDLHLAEPDSVRRAGYQSTGKTEPIVRAGQIAGDRKVRATYLQGLESESFVFELAEAGHLLLRRGWWFEGDGQKLHLKLNDGPEQVWDLTKGQGNDAGARETTFVLAGCRKGANHLSIRYEKPGNCAGYRLEPLVGDHVPLVRWGVLNTRQTRGEMLLHTSAVGTPLSFGKERAGDGIGAHATSFIEYPLDGQFSAFEVTTGIDGSTEGRGSVVFRIYVDGKERATSGLMTGFTKPKTLKVDKLDGAKRLILSVTDAEDGNRDDLANWIDGKLYLKGK
jgi:colicin import membrane protein